MQTAQPDPRIPADVSENFQHLRDGARILRKLPTATKNTALTRIADRVAKEAAQLVIINKKDLSNLAPDTSSAFRDRLTLNEKRIEGIVESLRQVAALSDPVGEVVDQQVLKNGLRLQRVRAPLGVILMIFESRPNVVLEAFSLAFKAGNAIALRGGSDSKETAQFLYQIMIDELKLAGIDQTVFYGMNNYDRKIVEALLEKKEWIDIVVPRGGDKLIEFVQTHAHMPIIKNDRGLCHTYVDNDADLEMAVKVVTNAKTQRPGVCNSLETVLVHRSIAERFLPRLYEATQSFGLKWKCDKDSLTILKDRENIFAADPQDWDTEHLDQIINCHIVSDLKEALEHIELHGSKHSEAIVTQDENKARKFQSEVDAAAVYWNASTRFTDGFEFGLGGELGISTQKLHVRGPVGLRELTTPRWIIDGTGQIRT